MSNMKQKTTNLSEVPEEETAEEQYLSYTVGNVTITNSGNGNVTLHIYQSGRPKDPPPHNP